MQTSITVDQLLTKRGERKLVDVRKPGARRLSGLEIPDAEWRHPFDAANWVDDVRGHPVVVICVHGHEVSQAVAGFLREEGVDAAYLEGGFEAWNNAGGAVQAMSEKDEG